MMNTKTIFVVLIYFLLATINIVLMIEDMKKDIKYMKERLKDGRQKQSNNNM